MNHMTAKEMLNISNESKFNENVEKIVAEILIEAKEKALEGKTSCEIRNHGFASSSNYMPNNETPEQLAAMKKLNNLGYKTEMRVEENHFVNIWLEVSWTE